MSAWMHGQTDSSLTATGVTRAVRPWIGGSAPPGVLRGTGLGHLREAAEEKCACMMTHREPGVPGCLPPVPGPDLQGSLLGFCSLVNFPIKAPSLSPPMDRSHDIISAQPITQLVSASAPSNDANAPVVTCTGGPCQGPDARNHCAEHCGATLFSVKTVCAARRTTLGPNAVPLPRPLATPACHARCRLRLQPARLSPHLHNGHNSTTYTAQPQHSSGPVYNL